MTRFAEKFDEGHLSYDLRDFYLVNNIVAPFQFDTVDGPCIITFVQSVDDNDSWDYSVDLWRDDGEVDDYVDFVMPLAVLNRMIDVVSAWYYAQP